jgi:hypothetical protein
MISKKELLEKIESLEKDMGSPEDYCLLCAAGGACSGVLYYGKCFLEEKASGIKGEIKALFDRIDLLEYHLGVKYIESCTEELPRYEKIKKVGRPKKK